ncbi:MAG: hypothetical protein DHS20C17_30430 [Cyclobacteriaceae bacterium]|nr:MAG: hypothetical protein DHS20C17_30430 [Cyclobacteriaceae bacterium]
MSKIVTRLIITTTLLGALGFLLFTKIDQTPYHQADFYRNTLARIDSLAQRLKLQQQQLQELQQRQIQDLPQSQKQSLQQVPEEGPAEEPAQPLEPVLDAPGLKAGWGKVNITPPQPVRLTGKNFKPYEQVFDSVYVRTFMFDNGVNRVLMINYDLWIMHPKLANAVRNSIHKAFPEVTGIYFTANHSHTSIGGWASGLLGSLVVGGNSPETLEFIIGQTLNSIRTAQRSLDVVRVGFGEVSTEGLVTNRLDQNGHIDNLLRVLKLENQRHELAVLNTFSAHSVYMDKDINTLSADYPGAYLDLLEEQETINFAAFAPGATGSHTPIGRKPFELKKMIGYSRNLAGYFSDLQGKIKTQNTSVLKYVELPVDLRSPHFRISNYWRFRPWIFQKIMGEMHPKITVIRIGNTVLVGLPVELSGEFYPELQSFCQQRGLSLMITSFNGWYLGYVNPERYYFTVSSAETREMNWFGPQNGEYFVELTKRILDII